MALINCGNSDKMIIVPIFGGIVRLVYLFLYDINPKEEILRENPLIRSIYVSLGMILSILPYFILRIRTNESAKRKDDNNSEEIKGKSRNKTFKLLYYDIYQKQRNNKYTLILLSSIFDFFQSIVTCSFCIKCVYNLWVLDIIIMSLFSFLILKNKIYIHHYLSIIMIIILGFALNIIEYFKKDDNEDKIDFSEIFWKFIAEICFCFALIIIKYNMEKNFCSIYEICIWHGFVNLILLIVCLLIFNKIKITILDFKYPDNFQYYKNNFNFNDLLMAFIIIGYSFIYNICIFFACDYFTAFHTLIGLIISEFYPYFKVKEKTLNIIGFIIIFIILVIFLIFIEIIELNFYGLSENTKKNITKRGRIDSESTLIRYSYNDYEIDNDTSEINDTF